MEKLEGLYPALVTPFDKNGKVDVNALQKLVDLLQKHEIDGFYVGGSTAESYLLSPDERKIILEAVKEACAPGKKLIANIGMLATEQSIDLAKHAEKIGVTAISSVPPFYFPFSMEELIQYYEDLSDAVSVPVLIYNIPAMSGVSFSTENLECLLSNPKIMGAKHTCYDLFQLQLLIERFPEKTFFIGQDELFLSALSVGIKAGIGSTYNIMPDKYVEMMRCFKEKRMDEALKIQGEVNTVVETLSKVGIFKGIKEILKLQGLDCGDARKPFQPLTEEEKKDVQLVAEKAHLIS